MSARILPVIPAPLLNEKIDSGRFSDSSTLSSQLSTAARLVWVRGKRS